MTNRLTKENRLKLKEFKFRGVSVREAAIQSNVSISTVLRWYNRPFGNLSDKIRRKTKLSQKFKRCLKRILSTTNSLRKTAKLKNISHSTVWRLCRRCKKTKGDLFPYKYQSKLRLSPLQRKKRLNYLKKYQFGDAQLKQFIFVDEKSFEIGHIPNKQN